MGIYAVITADLISSKSQPEQVNLLPDKMHQLNLPGLLTHFSISRGDEVQAVCETLPQLPVIIRRLRYQCYPLKLRVGVGIGPIDETRKMVSNSWDMNGEAFYLARAALQNQTTVAKKFPGTQVDSSNQDFNLAINTIYSLYDLTLERWTDKQWSTVHAYESYVTLVKTAAALNVSWQNVQKICKAANWERIKDTESNLALMLGRFF